MFYCYIYIQYANRGHISYRVYHSLGGLYLQFGNMKLKDRQKLKNHFLVGFVPFGAKFEETIQPFIQDIQDLENGFLVTIDNV